MEKFRIRIWLGVWVGLELMEYTLEWRNQISITFES